MLKREAVLAYLCFEQPCDLNNHMSDLKWYAILVQYGKLIGGFQIEKLNSAQMNYIFGEKELFGKIESSKVLVE